MKKKRVFLSGMGTGMVLTLVILMIIGSCSNNGATAFEEPGEEIEGDAFEVFQVLPSGDALAVVKEKHNITGDDFYTTTGVIVMLPHDKGKTYYDDLLIEIPADMCARQIGVYRYMTKEKGEKTVPVVGIYDKED